LSFASFAGIFAGSLKNSLACIPDLNEGQRISENLPGCAVQMGSVAGVIGSNLLKIEATFNAPSE